MFDIILLDSSSKQDALTLKYLLFNVKIVNKILKRIYWTSSRAIIKVDVCKSNASAADAFCTSPRKKKSSSMATRKASVVPIIKLPSPCSKKNIPTTRASHFPTKATNHSLKFIFMPFFF